MDWSRKVFFLFLEFNIIIIFNVDLLFALTGPCLAGRYGAGLRPERPEIHSKRLTASVVQALAVARALCRGCDRAAVKEARPVRWRDARAALCFEARRRPQFAVAFA